MSSDAPPGAPPDAPPDPYERIYLLYRYIDGIEEPVGDDREEVMDIVMHYRTLVSARLGMEHQDLPMSHFAGTIGSILFYFSPEFPAKELPACGPGSGEGISNFEYNGSEFRFELEGAKVVAAMNVADHLHHIGQCKAFMCPEPTCYNYCAALDEQLFLPPSETYFVRYAPRFPHTAVREEGLFGRFEGRFPVVWARDGKNEMQPCEVRKSAQLGPGEHLVQQLLPPNARTHGDYICDGKYWEIMPAPADSSQLDMHLARLSSLDSRYVMRFNSEIRHLFEDTTPNGAFSADRSDCSESDFEGEDAFVESALVPGLQQKDFNRVVDVADALKQFKLSDKSEEDRLRALLAE